MDGAGKTTLVHRLAERLASRRVSILHLPFSPFVNDALNVAGSGTPLGDPWTDRLAFALDNRLAAYHMEALKPSTDVLITQRGWMDSYIHGAAQGLTYEELTVLMHTTDLPKADYSIYLNCNADVAFERVRHDEKADKFETLSFMRRQHMETERFYKAIDGDAQLDAIFNGQRIYIDTTSMSPVEVEGQAVAFLRSFDFWEESR